jgi:predicted ATPase
LGDDGGLAPLKQLLIERTGGNPFFLEESVRTLIESQVLVGGRGAYRLAKGATEIQVPATVQAVLAARIDRLLPEVKRLLQTEAGPPRPHHGGPRGAVSRPLSRTGRTAGPPCLPGEVWEKALSYSRQAGMKAFARSANHEAVACFEQALQALARLPERRETIEQAIDLRFELCNALFQLSTELASATELYRAMEMTFWLPQAERALAQVEGQ